MLNRFISAVAVLFLLAGFLIAAEYKGTLTKIDEGKTITVKIGDDEKTFKINDKTEFTAKRKGEDVTLKADQVAKMLEKATKGRPVTIKTEGEGSKEVVTKVSFTGGKGKGKTDK
jgi:hypothetical protein